MVNNTTELLNLIIKSMSEKGIELNHIDLYEEAIGINNKVKVCIGHNYFLVYKEGRGRDRGIYYYSNVGMLDKVLELLTENDWLPGDDVESYGEWFTLVVEESSYCAEKNQYQVYRLLDDNYNLSDRKTLEDLRMGCTNVSLADRLIEE